MDNPRVKTILNKGHAYINTLNEYGEKRVEFDMAWNLIFEITDWSKSAGNVLISLGESNLKIQNLLEKNPAETSALIFASKMTDYKNTQVQYLEKLKKFIILFNSELIKRITTPSKINTIYLKNDEIFTSIGEAKKSYKLEDTTKKYKLINALYDHEELTSKAIFEATGYKAGDYSLLNKEIKATNSLAKQNLEIKEDLILHDQSHTYKLNRVKYIFIKL